MLLKKKQKATSRLWLILMGEEWTGKSSAGNTMLGRTVFKVDSDTEHVVQSFGVIEGRNVTVVDTPGWNTDCSPDVPLTMLKKAHSSASLIYPGFHVLLLTIPISQSQVWNQKVAQRLSNALKFFSDDIWKHTMLLFTRADLLHSTGLEGYLKGSGQPFQDLVEKCGHRYHVLNNHKQNDCKQVSELLEKTEQMVQENNGQSLQLVTGEQEVSTLRKYEMDNMQLVERCSKMEEDVERESCFKLEDYMFKSLRPRENDPPNPTEQNELPEENNIHVLRSEHVMSPPVDMQEAALEYIHIQDEETESPSDLCSGSTAEINISLAMSSDDGNEEASHVDQTELNTCTEVEETGMDQIPGDEEKNKQHLQHSALQRHSPQTWDHSWDLSITCYFDIDDSNQQCVVTNCVLQTSVYWRKMKCQTEWISFTVCGDNINWLFILVLYLFVRYLCLIYKTYEISKETGDQTKNTLIPGFVQCQQEPEKQGAFQSLLGQMGNNRPKSLDEEITKCSKMKDDKEILQHNMGDKNEEVKKGEDEELPKHFHKGEGEDKEEEGITQQSIKAEDGELPKCIYKGEEEEEEEESQQIIGANEKIPHQSKMGDDKEIPQNDYNKDGDNIHQQRQRVDDYTLQPSIKKDEKQMLQNNKRVYEETDQQRNAVEGAEILKLNRINDDISQNNSRHRGVKKKCRMTKMVEYEKTPKHSRRRQNKKGDYEEMPQQSKRRKAKEISKHIIKDMEGIPQHNKRGYKEVIPQYNRGGDKKMFPQHNRRGNFKEIPQTNKRVYEELIPRAPRLGDDKAIPRYDRGMDNEMIPKHSRRTDNEETHQPKSKGDDGDIYQHCKSAYDHEKIPRHNRSGLDEEIPLRRKREDGKEMPQPFRKRDNDEVPQHGRKGNEKEVPQHTSVGHDEEIKQALEQDIEGKVQMRSANKKIHHKWHRNQHIKDINNVADTKDEDENANRIRQVVRRQQSPEARAASSSKLNHKAGNTLDMRRVEFEGARKLVRSLSMDLLVNLRYAGEEDMRQHGCTWKIRRNKSLERFIVFNVKEEKTAMNRALPKSF